MKKTLLITATLLISTSIAYADNPPAAAATNAGVKTTSDYPTQARVEFVFQCMSKYGKETYNTMYGCVCAVDKVAETIPYKNYVATATLAVMINTPGEKGGIYRDAPGGRKAIRAFKSFIKDTEKSCGLKKIS